MKFVGLIDIGSCHWRHRVFSGGYVTGRPCGTQECAGQVCGGVDIFSSEHMKFVGQLIDVGSCCWRHRVFSRGYVTGRPLQNSRMCWVSLWRCGHIFVWVHKIHQTCWCS